MKIILPKTYLKEFEYPVIYLGGPARGAPHWQDKALEILYSEQPNLIVASSRKFNKNILSEDIIKGDENFFERQRAWERYYMDVASKEGTILFWLPEEEQHTCEKVYGAMTRFELGWCIGNYKKDKNFNFCVGSDGKFQELRAIEYDLNLDAPDKKINKTLEETCKEAIKLAYKYT